MGANVSTQNIESMTKQINKTLTEVSTTISNTAESTNSSRQSVRLDLQGSKNCRAVISQTSNSSLSAMSQFTNETYNDISNQLKNKLNEEIAQIVKQKNEGINFGQTNVSDLRAISDTYVENNMQNVIKSQISSIISNTNSVDQEVVVYAKNMECDPKDPSIVIDQKAVIEQISSNIANTLVKNAIKNVAENDVAKKITQTSDQTNAGLTFGGMIFLLIAAAAFTFFFGYKIMCYIIPIFIAVVAYGIYYYSQTNLKITLGVLIVCEIILICLELYFIYKAVRGNSKVTPMPKSIQIPAVSIST